MGYKAKGVGKFLVFFHNLAQIFATMGRVQSGHVICDVILEYFVVEFGWK